MSTVEDQPPAPAAEQPAGPPAGLPAEVPAGRAAGLPVDVPVGLPAEVPAGLTAGLPAEELALALRVLAAAERLPIEHPDAVAIQRATASLYKTVKRRRRSERREAIATNDGAVTQATATGAEGRIDDETQGLPLRSRASGASAGTLLRARACYVCKQRYTAVDAFYHQLCPGCAAGHHAHRGARTDLRGRRALLTGGRAKIGMYIALRLLRDGAHTTITTRFPRDAARRFAAMEDSGDWLHRLRIVGIDLRDPQQVQALADTVAAAGPLDILINNAAQTVRRSPGAYAALAAAEGAGPAGLGVAGAGRDGAGRKGAGPDGPRRDGAEPEGAGRDGGGRDGAGPEGAEPEGGGRDGGGPEIVWLGQSAAAHPALLAGGAAGGGVGGGCAGEGSEAGTGGAGMHAREGTAGASVTALALRAGSASAERIAASTAIDAGGLVPDLAASNSWVQRVEEVDALELLEVQLCNVSAPFILVSRLRGALAASPARRKYVVNVSAMEGQFSRGYKGPGHPHTNMAKAAMNMLTRTSAQELLETDGILMTSVDTGWITDERPHPTKMRLADAGFHAPLDLVDGAARVYDPIVRGEAGEDLYGCFIKDYEPSAW
jgi:NAD(P)-dependent dehydrogenase (short-subunit alcohol dehydrogenase family)